MATTISTQPIINKPRKVMRNAFILTALMIAGAVITGYSNLDGMNGGYALVALFIFFALSAFITALVYIPRAKEFHKLIQQLHPLAHWTYTQQEWEAFIKEDLKETISVNKATLRLVIIISVFVCGFLLLIYRDNLFILIIGGIILLLTLVAFIAPFIRRNILKKGIHEAFIGNQSAYVGGTFQSWNQLGARLTNIVIYTEAAIPIMHIIFEYPTLRGNQQSIFRIPVPAGKLEDGKKIAETLQKQAGL
ncbi:MAG: hypothetical protein IPO53_08830 [Chitinophagaceae bacterium]|nr:hypothetical protein [Chitinophagaceae bacterium]